MIDKIDFTFGIITAGGNEEGVNKMIDSIEAQNIPCYEVIIIGDCNISRKNTIVKPFDESIKSKWITRKKNLVTYYAMYENIVFMHDYIILDPGWYEGFLKFGNDFKVASNITLDVKNERWVDWSLWWEDVVFTGLYSPKNDSKETRIFLLPYDVTDLSQFMYIGGSYWVAKKAIMKEFPLDEGLIWGQGEDLVWSKQVRKKYDFSFNSNSTVHFLKEKGNPFTLTTLEMVNLLRKRKDDKNK